MLSILLLSVGTLTSLAVAQQAEWGQCGGIGWSGPTTCVSGTYCSVLNDYYSQCIPGTQTTAAATSTKSKAAIPSAGTSTAIKYLISFGDSYSQTGFEITGAKASSSNPLGNPAFPGYTTTNGDNWIGYLISKYNKSLLLSYNFAYGGATTDSSLVTPYSSSVLSLVNQVSEFSNNLASKPSYCPWTSSNALFAIWIGINDVGNAYGESDWSSLSGKIVDRYFQEVQVLYNAGARNFLFLTVPPIQKTPLMLENSASVQKQIGAAVATYNNLVKSAVSSFKSSNSGVKTYLYDTTTPFNTALSNPKAYGASDATSYNSNGVSSLWWNNFHPGQAIHNLVAEGVASLTGL